jgi:hypothetical protein
VYQHDIELARQAQGSHVADEVLTLRVERAIDGHHSGRAIGQREVKVCLQVRGQASAT